MAKEKTARGRKIMALTLEAKIKLIMKERKSVMELGCKNAKIIYVLTADFYKSSCGEYMQREDYDCAVKMQYKNETKKENTKT